MKHIIKKYPDSSTPPKIEPDYFSNYKKTNNYLPALLLADARNAKEIWDDFSNKAGVTKGNLQNDLLEEQGFLCCYCQDKIKKPKDKTLPPQIEHFLPKSLYKAKMFDYDNLFGCCDSYNASIPACCGESKGNKEININPLDATCENRFYYYDVTTTEETEIAIVPADENDIDAQNAIDILNLDNNDLRKARGRVIKSYLDLSPEDLRLILKNILDQNNAGFKRFALVIKKFIENNLL